MVFLRGVEDGVCEGLGVRAAAGADVIGEFAPPGGVSRKVALACSHLVYSTGDKIVQAHEGVRGESRWVGVIIGGGVQGCPVVQEGISGPLFKGEVCFPHELRRGDVGPSWGGSVENHGKV